MKARSEDLYLDLMKKTLAFMLWPEPPIPVEMFNYRRSGLKRLVMSAISRVLFLRRFRLVQDVQVSAKDREEGLIWPGYAHTMIGLKRLDNIQFCVETAIRDGVEGDLIETGVWRGGACILMRAILAAHGIEDRRVFVADSFAGLPKPDPKEFPADQGDTHYTHEYLAVSRDAVEDNFRKFGLLDDQVEFLKGWFCDTLPGAPISKLAVLRLDGDMYSSTMDTLTNLYPKLSSGGFCIIDDYDLKGCRQAVDDYRQEFGIVASLEKIDNSGVFWRKE